MSYLAMVPRPSAMTFLDKVPRPSAFLDVVLRLSVCLDTVSWRSAVPCHGASA